MNLIELLESGDREIVAEASAALSRAPMRHYSESAAEQNRRRMVRLFLLTQESVRMRDLGPMLEYARAVARGRSRDGFDLLEVQTAFNLLEEVIWKRIVARLDPADCPEALGLVSTVLGAGKQALAAEYVTLASRSSVPVLDLEELFKGT